MSRAVRPAAALLLSLLAAPLTACGGDPGPVALEVTVQDWTGWSAEQPEPVRRSVELAEGESLSVTMLGDEVTITVEDVDDDEVELVTSEELAPRNPGGGANLEDLRSEFTVERGGSVAFTTPSLDGGTTVTVVAD